MPNEQRGQGCGAHQVGDAIPGSTFDYTCDDCMLPDVLDPDMIDRNGNRYAQYEEYMKATNGTPHNPERIQTDKIPAKARRIAKGRPRGHATPF